MLSGRLWVSTPDFPRNMVVRNGSELEARAMHDVYSDIYRRVTKWLGKPNYIRQTSGQILHTKYLNWCCFAEILFFIPWGFLIFINHVLRGFFVWFPNGVWSLTEIMITTTALCLWDGGPWLSRSVTWGHACLFCSRHVCPCPAVYSHSNILSFD